MADSKGIRAGRAFVELFTDDSKLARGLKAASARLKAWGESIASMGKRVMGLGMAVYAPLSAMAVVAAESGAELYEMARRTGMSVEALSGLSYAAAMTGTEMGSLQGALFRMEKTIAGVEDAAEGTTGSLTHLGLSAADMKDLSIDEKFALIASRIAAIPDPAERAAAAMKVFGRAGAQLIPLLEEYGHLHDQAKAFGFIKTERDVAEAKAMQTAITFLSLSFKSLTGAIGGAIMPYLTELWTRVARITLGVRDWIKENKALVLSIFKWAGVAVSAGVGLFLLGKAIGFVGLALSGVRSIMTGIGAAVSIASTVFTTLGPILMSLLNPIGLIVVAVLGLAAYFLVFSGMAGQAMDWMGAKCDELQKDAAAAFGGISDALAAGDIGLAAKVLWLTLKMEWTKGVNAISQIWNGGLLWIRQRLVEAFFRAIMILEDIWHGLEVAWIETTAVISETWTTVTAGLSNAWSYCVAGLGNIWTRFTQGFTSAWDWCASSLEKSWNWIKSLFSDDFDSEAANKAVDARYNDAQKRTNEAADKAVSDRNAGYEADKAKIWRDADAKKAAREQQRQTERKTASETHEGTLNGLITEAEKVKQDMQTEYDKKLGDNQTELDNAKKEWQDAIDSAGQKRAAKDAARGEAGKFESPEDLMAKLKGNLGGLEEGLAKKHSQAGTFNASAAWGFGGGQTALDKIAVATEKSERHLQKIVNADGTITVG